MKRFIVFSCVIVSFVFAARFWTTEELELKAREPKGPAVFQYEVDQFRGNWQSWSYIHEFFQTAAFIATMQVDDSLDPEYGGIIEGEDALNIVETDNTQEAIWVWSRYYQLTGDTTYFENLRRAWIYVMNHPAYLEEGGDSDYYRVWNCGLALFCEQIYRNTFNDTTYSWYADTCVEYMYEHPLPFDQPTYQMLHPKVTSLAAGMLYQYGKEQNNQVYKDTALVYGNRVKAWIEANPATNINNEQWAMSGGTAVWGICRSVFDDDTAAGIAWLGTYIPYMKYHQPTGTWNNSWNIWYANAYNGAARILDNATYVDYHHSLTDTLLVQDYDDDGGVPPTSTWGPNQDHAWVSTYMVFMGFENLMDSIKNTDAGVTGIAATGPQDYFLVGDSISIAMVVANCGFYDLGTVYCGITGPFTAETTLVLALGEEDTIFFPTPWVPSDTGYQQFSAYCTAAGDERIENDTLETSFYVKPLRLVSGSVQDSLNASGIYSQLYFQFINATGEVYFDSAQTDSVTGYFEVYLIDSLYRTFVYTEIPYPDIIMENIYVTPDSISDLDIFLDPADLLIVNRDYEGEYAEYYVEALDSLDVTCKVWTAVDHGIFPISRIDEFNNDVIIWYTGKSETDNVTAQEQDSLIQFLDAGGKLLITGQNIGQEINGTTFYMDYLHAVHVDDTITVLSGYPDTTDPLGQYISRIWTAGGCPNQYSRDVVASDGNAHEFLFYETALENCSGIWYEDPVSQYKIVYFGFGVEAVHSRPGYMPRWDFLNVFLDWFGIVSIQEVAAGPAASSTLRIYPNPARHTMHIGIDGAQNIGTGTVRVYDASGRLVRTIAEGNLEPLMTWDLKDVRGRRVPDGIYFVAAKTDNARQVFKTIILK
ncbi:MAG: T9SS type A sorting domain-containing protein [candidate division WOR-3 bacterium]|nr:MAG: T9SS type A sorting domain-containing protein [candidate division WOR-3 bacterium]